MAIKSVISLKDNFTAVIRTARKETQGFSAQIKSTRQTIQRLQSMKKEVRIKAKMDNIKPRVDKIKEQLNRFKKPIMIGLAYKEIGKEKLNKIKNKTQSLFIKAKDFSSPVISKIKSGLGSLGSFAKKVGIGIGVGLLAGLGTGFNGALNLEQQKVSMEHFIGIQNKGMTKQQVSQSSDDYVKWLRTNANKTPFETGEVVSAGARAVNVAGGNIDQAKSLVSLAENMAALNPGKSVMDAMEALADLKLGESERMKEFGFKLNSNDFTGGKGKMSDMNPQQFADAYSRIVSTKLNPFFEGGAEKIAQTRKGQISTIVGVGKSILTDVSTKLLEKDGGSIGKMADYLSNNAGRIVTNISSAMERVFNIVDTGLNYIKTGFKAVKPYLLPIADFLKNGISDRITFIGSLITQWKPVIMEVWETMKNAFTRLWPVISTLFTNAWGLIKSVITMISPIAAQIATFILDLVNNYIIPMISFMGTFINGIVVTIKGIIDALSPVISGLVVGFIKAIQGILDFITGVFTLNWKKAWDGILNIFKGIWDFIKGALETIGKVLSLGGGGSSPTQYGQTTSTKDNPMGVKLKPHATGLRRVPRDNYPALLHEGEQVLTAQETRQKKSQSAISIEEIVAKVISALGDKGKSLSVSIAKLADSIVVREDADIDKIIEKLVRKLEDVSINMA